MKTLQSQWEQMLAMLSKWWEDLQSKVDKAIFLNLFWKVDDIFLKQCVFSDRGAVDLT